MCRLVMAEHRVRLIRFVERLQFRLVEFQLRCGHGILEMLHLAEGLLATTEAGKRAVRLLGLTVSQFVREIPVEDPLQLELPF